MKFLIPIHMHDTTADEKIRFGCNIVLHLYAFLLYVLIKYEL